MKSQILKKALLRNLALSAVVLLALAATAHAQGTNGYGVQASCPNGQLQAKDAADKESIKQYINRRETEEGYEKAIREQPSAKASTDPWGNVRPTTTTPAVKPAAKPATKSASTAAKPVKPAAGAAPNGQ
jgi:hypothetical protein